MNKRFISIVLLIAFISIVAAACSDNVITQPEDTEEAANNSMNEELNEEQNTEAPSQEIIDPEAETPDVDAAEPDTEEAETPDMELEAMYYMNGIYDILPLDKEADQNVVLLTFDDGPKDEALVTEMLDVLAMHDAKAIFFVNGYRVEQNPELLIRIHEAGHPIGNHSWDHIDLAKESADSAAEQVNKVQEIVTELTGQAPMFFRPPFGSGNDTVREIVKNHGMLYMTWSNGSLDWDKSSQSPEAVIANVLEQLRPGSNILMHELEWTVKGLDDLLTQLTDRGYSFVNPHQIEVTPE